MMAVKHKTGVVPESRSRSRWEFKSLTDIRTFVGSSTGTNREVQKLAIEAHRNFPRRSSQSPRAYRESAEALPRVRWMYAGSKPEARWKSN